MSFASAGGLRSINSREPIGGVGVRFSAVADFEQSTLVTHPQVMSPLWWTAQLVNGSDGLRGDWFAKALAKPVTTPAFGLRLIPLQASLAARRQRITPH